MSKRVTAPWYVGAWTVGLIAVAVFLATTHPHAGSTYASAVGRSPIPTVAWTVAGACGLLMLIMWIGALVRLGQAGRWGWFAAVLVLHLAGLGIVGMVAYALSGPEDHVSVTRPSLT